MGRLGPTEIILILVVIILLFGAKKLPDMARSLGKSARILKSEAKAMKADDQQVTPVVVVDPPTPGAQEQSAPRTIEAACGDAADSPPVTEPSDAARR
ncbi:Sec-independent protein translocase subunit TatA [Streptomyces sp. NPDC047981]|uniref:Sec-independent protein translocase subunit TatA n=1 Tax=Streptomyces sp. NPDC047981 TaxID=3154610 RepID=UPI0034159E4B